MSLYWRHNNVPVLEYRTPNQVEAKYLVGNSPQWIAWPRCLGFADTGHSCDAKFWQRKRFSMNHPWDTLALEHPGNISYRMSCIRYFICVVAAMCSILTSLLSLAHIHTHTENGMLRESKLMHFSHPWLKIEENEWRTLVSNTHMACIVCIAMLHVYVYVCMCMCVFVHAKWCACAPDRIPKFCWMFSGACTKF